MSVEKLIKLLEAKFPKAWFKHGKEFGGDTTTAVWTGEGSYVDSDENIPMFDYDNMTDSYDFGAHVELCKFVEEHGYYVEPYDAGTYFIYPN